jgi:hypothetical protein
MSTLRANRIQTITGKTILNNTGSILQVVQTVKKDAWGTTSTGGTQWYEIAGFNATITPSSVSSKILVQGNLHLSTGYWEVQGRLTRNGTSIPGALGDVRGARSVCTFADNTYSGGTSGYNWYNVTFQYLDSPSSTSVQTYGIYVNGYSTYSIGVNYNVYTDNNDGDFYGQPISTITLMEISG